MTYIYVYQYHSFEWYCMILVSRLAELNTHTCDTTHAESEMQSLTIIRGGTCSKQARKLPISDHPVFVLLVGA